MRIPTKTAMHRLQKDSSPSSISSFSRCGGDLGNSTGATSCSSSGSSTPSLTLLKDIQVEEEFSILKTLSRSGGQFSKLLLAKQTLDGEKLVIKGLFCNNCSFEDFNREVHLTYFLSPHPNIVSCFNVTFLWDECYCFLQEYTPLGSIQDHLGLSIPKVKLLSSQISSALDFMHHLHLVHGAVVPSNILVFNKCRDFKLCNFSQSREEGSLVLMKKDDSLSPLWKAPEIVELLPQEKYNLECSMDVWQLGILIYYSLSGGKGPWRTADRLCDPSYRSYDLWRRRKSMKLPEFLKPFSARAIRLLKRLLEHKPGNRAEVKEVRKYLKDEWMNNGVNGGHESGGERRISTGSIGDEVQCGGPSLLGELKKPSKIDKRRVLEQWIISSSITGEEENEFVRPEIEHENN